MEQQNKQSDNEFKNEFIFRSRYDCYKIYGFRFIGKTKIELPTFGNILIIRNTVKEDLNSFSVFELNEKTNKVIRMFKLSQIEEIIFEKIDNKKNNKKNEEENVN